MRGLPAGRAWCSRGRFRDDCPSDCLCVALDDAERDKRCQEHRDDGPEYAYHALLLGARQVVGEIACQEERDIDRDEHGDGAPPGVDPHERWRARKKDLEEREAEGATDGEDDAVVDAEDLDPCPRAGARR